MPRWFLSMLRKVLIWVKTVLNITRRYRHCQVLNEYFVLKSIGTTGGVISILLYSKWHIFLMNLRLKLETSSHDYSVIWLLCSRVQTEQVQKYCRGWLVCFCTVGGVMSLSSRVTLPARRKNQPFRALSCICNIERT